MSFLDRFKPVPRWKHADPAVRTAAVDELTAAPEHQRVVVELATSDEDARVRRAAIAHVTGVQDLVQLARSESDGDNKQDVVTRLLDAAIAAPTEAEAALALEGLDDQRHLADVAKTSPHPAIRAAALARVVDARSLSSIARKAADPQTALAAVTRIEDTAELFAVATKTEHKDTGLAALERAAEGSDNEDLRQALETVSVRAKHKSIAKRARIMVQALEETAASRRAAVEQWQERVAALFARVETLAAAPVTAETSAHLESTQQEWRNLSASDLSVVDDDTAARFNLLAAAAQASIERHERVMAEQRATEEERNRLRAARQRICEQVEALSGESTPDSVDTARGEWESLTARSDDADATADLQARFEAACLRATERQENRQNLAQTHARLEALSQDAERITTSETFDDEAWRAVAAEWASLLERAEGLDPVVVQRVADAQTRVNQRAAERHAAEERVVRQYVQRVEQLIERAQARAAAEDLTLREADRLSRDLRGALDAPPKVDERERQLLADRVKAAQLIVAPRLQDLRELDEWKRFANAAVQEELIARTEGLVAKYNFSAEGGPSPDDVEKAARDLHDIQERWTQVAEAPRAQAQALWQRYRHAADPIQARAREFFAARTEERKGNLERKLALIERAEALAPSTDWIKTADELKKLQQEWQQIGAVPRNDTKATWKRFRDACDTFFTRRNADLNERKETWAANLAKKEALCARAEELAASRDWDRAAVELRRLQGEWKAIGPVRRTKSDAIWQRFRAAADLFFDRYKRRDEIDLEAKQADRQALIVELDALATPTSSDGADAGAGDLVDRVRSLRTRWNQTTSVVRQGVDPLGVRFGDALERVMTSRPEQFRGTELDVDASRDKMEKLIAKVEGFVADAPQAPANSSQALAEMLREALATNTIGGRANDEARWRAMGEDVRQAQAAWSRLGPVPGQTGRDLSERFHRACHRFSEQYRRRVPPTPQSAPRKKELQTR